MPVFRQGAVLGHPIGHSKSPALHNAAYAVLGLDYSYTAIDVQVHQFPAFLDQVRSDGSWYGLSVTMPLKNAAAQLADELTDVAAALGSVNTLVASRTDDGGTRFLGDNTDVAGIVNALRQAGVAPRPRAAVLGGGGTAVSAVAAMARLGAPEVDIFVRDTGRSSAALAVAARLGVPARLVPYTGAAQALAGYGVVVSTLPPQAADPLAQELPASLGKMSGACLLDVAYDPWPSALAAAWERAGGTVVPGIEMLLYQGVEQALMFAAAGGHGDAAAGRTGELINVMCDALGLEHRTQHK
ncbi:shikimate dehydrogenase [Arthrobacter sp. A2-55]|uniref:shikimate dehydrogenase n=1 Tax=Arthrobacter sp. A2-55 TaxID=2897337 RepID=UPI00292F65F6|nr:shikimate dehydrogenase [Arthrobacter sp. A2-55]